MSNNARRADSTPPAIDLRGLASDAAYERILEALAERRVSIPEALKLGGLVKVGIDVKEVAQFRARLLSAEAAHKASLEATRRLAPARRQIVDASYVEMVPPPTVAAVPTAHSPVSDGTTSTPTPVAAES
jgi:hypothetical protein